MISVGPTAVARRAALAGTFLSLLIAAAVLHSPSKQEDEPAPPSPTATCTDGKEYEKLTCTEAYKVTKCFDAELTCASWDVNDCCSPVALHKCLSPIAGRAFDADCSSIIDAREECCADPVTHKRSFAALAEVEKVYTATTEQAVETAKLAGAAVADEVAKVEEATKEYADKAVAAASPYIDQAVAAASDVTDKAVTAASYAVAETRKVIDEYTAE